LANSKISIITVTWNVESTLADTIESVKKQNYGDIEYIIIDGGSTDGTLNLAKTYSDTIHLIISEPDTGIYDAINKGIRAATGDVIGFLHADDLLSDDTIVENIAFEFDHDENLESVIGDIVFVKQFDPTKVVRNYSSQKWEPSKFAWGFMPPHPSFFCRKAVYSKYGLYKTDYKIAADYELLIRYLLVKKVSYKYLPLVTTRMRLGGVSTRGIKSLVLLNKETKRALRENNIYTNYFMIYSKYVFKIFEFFKKYP
jgi:glycosyltransferase involved in cell wall biosynthesis